MAVNDGAVMMNWAKSQKVGLSMLSFLGDPNSEFTKALVSLVVVMVVCCNWCVECLLMQCSWFLVNCIMLIDTHTFYHIY